MRIKRPTSLFLGMAATILLSTSAWAAQKTWTGKISDSSCGASHKAAIEHGGKAMSDADCSRACVKGGAKWVFVHKGKVIPIANQDFAGLEEHAGHTVHLSGEMAAGSVTVAKLEMPASKK